MKAIIMNYNETTDKNRPKRGHCLNVLFAELPPDVQEKTKKRVQDILEKGQQEERENLTAALSDKLPPEVEKAIRYAASQFISTFDELLVKNAKAFETWRYGYETEDDEYLSCDIQFLMELCAALEEIISADT